MSRVSHVISGNLLASAASNTRLHAGRRKGGCVRREQPWRNTMQDQLDASGQPPSRTEDNTRRDLLLYGALMSGAIAAGAVAAPEATAQEQPAKGKSLYDRLGGIFAIAAVVNYFSDEIIKDPVAGARSANPQLREWHTKQLDRLPGLKFMRTLWVAAAAGGPYQYTPVRPGATNLGLENAHKDLKISPEEHDAVARGRSS